MKRFLTGVLALVMILSLTACKEASAQKQVFAMDTVMTLSAYGKPCEDALKEAEMELYRLEALLSRTAEASTVSAINEAAGAVVFVEEEVAELLLLAKQYTELTDGAFDITIAPVVSAWGFTEDVHCVPEQQELERLLESVGEAFVEVRDDGSVTLAPESRIDLGGIAKGYASDRVAQIFEAHGVERGWISLGGNVMAKGTRPDGEPWKVGIQHPEILREDSFVGMVFLENGYAVTSGGYQRYFEKDGQTYHHIIDPATGCPADSGLLSVTVVAGLADGFNGTMCDALSTALFVMGEEKALEFRRSSGLDFDLVLVTEDGRVVVTDGLADRFAEAEGSGYTYETVS